MKFWKNETILQNYYSKKGVFKIGPEKQFEEKVKSYLRTRGAYFVKFFANGFTRSGVPDILACVNGQFIGIEVKAQNGKPSELQLHNIRAINQAGGFGFILYPSAFEVFKAFINVLDQYKPLRNTLPEIWR